MRHRSFTRKVNNSKQFRLINPATVLIALMLLISAGLNASAQSTPQNKDSDNKADSNLKSTARVNPMTLAMEITMPMMSYPGRNGNSMSYGISYSSKLWRMGDSFTYWYPLPYSCNKQYVTLLNAKFAERSASGWTSSIAPPIIEEKTDFYDENGRPTGNEFDEVFLNNLFEDLGRNQQSLFDNLISDPNRQCGWFCAERECGPDGGCHPTACRRWDYNFCRSTGGWGDEPTGCGNPPPTPPSKPTYYIKRVQVRTSDGSTHEFRKSDARFGFCFGPGDWRNGPSCENTNPDNEGVFLSVDGSGMRLERNASTGSTLFMPDGSRYKFPAAEQHLGIDSKLFFATEYRDADGNIASFSEQVEGDQVHLKQTDTIGREIIDPLPQNFGAVNYRAQEQDLQLPGLNGTQDYKLLWKRLKPHGCEGSTDPNCGGGDGALENQAEKLYYDTNKICMGSLETPIQGTNEFLFPLHGWGIRSCSSFYFDNDPNGNPVSTPDRFNPVVLAKVVLPHGKTYEFKYNQWAEITKITYPMGSYEKFEYGRITPLTPVNEGAYEQANRGVKKRWIYASAAATEPEQYWTYEVDTTNRYKITTTVSNKDNPAVPGMRTERYLIAGTSNGIQYGFDNPLTGMPVEEITKDENDALRSRTLTEWTTTGAIPTGDPYRPAIQQAKRDPRAVSTISIIFENNKALATMSEKIYEDPSTNTNIPSDLSYFARLNVKQTKNYHYLPLDWGWAQSADINTLKNLFYQWGQVAGISETEYLYNENYKNRGISSLPIKTKTLNPANPSEFLTESQIIYDNAFPAPDPNYTPYQVPASGGISELNCSSPGQIQKICWRESPDNYRGKATTTKVWDNSNNNWIKSHIQYDQFGNPVKAKDALGRETETEFANEVQGTNYNYKYFYAYPTRTKAPAPDPNGNTGSSQPFFSSTVYDAMTGLPLSVTNENDTTTVSDDLTTYMLYEDALLRPTKVIPPAGSGQTETIYNDVVGNLWVKSRKQIDTNKWVESVVYMDSLGKTTKAESIESSGNIIVETQYDKAGHVKKVSNPYRQGDTTIYWTENFYDPAGRLFKVKAQDGTETLTGFDFSTTGYSIGTVITATDAAGRKGRAVTNALGQLIRVDEPSSTNELLPIPTPSPGASPTPNPSPSPTPPDDIPPNCLDDCLNNLANDYPTYSTYYTYDALGRMIKVKQGDQYRYFKYDNLGRLIRVRQPEQEVNNALETTGNPDNNQWAAGFTYDALGNVLTATDAKNVTITNIYDNHNRVKTRTYSDTATPPISFFYDGVYYDANNNKQAATGLTKGGLTQVKNSVSVSQTIAFDSLGKPLTYQQITDGQIYATQYQYNAVGILVQETYPSGRVVRSDFNQDGHLARIYGKASQNALEKTFANSFNYAPTGLIEKLRLGNGKWESAKFNNRLQITEIGLGNGATDTSLWQLNYAYGELTTNENVDTSKNTGNIAKQTISFSDLAHPFVQTYKYDSLYRLTEAKETNNGNQTWKQRFAYDRYGNRTGFEQIVGQNQLQINDVTHPTINPANNRFDEEQDYLYDKNGNLTQVPTTLQGTRHFTFNSDNKQTEVRNQQSELIGQYFYDGDGRRIKKKVYANQQVTEETVFVYSKGKLIAEYSTQPVQNQTTSYLTTDHLGSPRVISDTNGEVKSRRDFMPFGEELYAGTPNRSSQLKYTALNDDAVRQKFTGYQEDKETGLDFAEARYYNNQHARFTAVDPLLASGKSDNPQSFNRYVYCRNNPFIYVDKDGRYPTEIHNQIINTALGGLTSKELQMINYGSALIDTTLGTGSYIQIGDEGNNPYLAAGMFVFDFPRTLLPSEAYMHAMIPAGMSESVAKEKSWSFVVNMINAGLTEQNSLDPTGNSLSLNALISFGRASHTMTDSTSPTHRFFQEYGIPTKEAFDPETGIHIGTEYDWVGFVREGLSHSKGESRQNISDNDLQAAITLVRLNFLTSFGQNAFERAVPNQDDRNRIYELVKKRGLVIPKNRGVAESWSIQSNLPANAEQLQQLHSH